MMRFVLLWMLWTLWPGLAQAVETIYYPRPESAMDQRSDYPIELLELALKKSGVQYRLRPSALVMPQSRALLELGTGSGFVTIAWSMTSKAREQQALPIRFPIDKGLLGWRLALVTRDNVDLFKGVRNLRDLGVYTAGMGHDWPDTELFRSNALEVFEAHNYELLFRMLANQRFHYFPRSINEVWGELAAHKDDGLVVARHIMLHYTAPFYFFVSKNNTRLASAVSGGLERALADGSFERLFRRYYGKQIRQAGPGRRRIIELPNPALPVETPLDRPELWLRLP
jgi:hypothetical protein